MSETLHLPPFVNYSCTMCGWCCHQYDITFSKADHDRLAQYDWGKLEPSMAGKEWCEPLKDRDNPDTWRLRYADDGKCVFLGPENKCLMHRHVGEMGKTFACCAYPFTFAATPTGVYVGCRFSCRAVAYGLGEAVARKEDCIRKQYDLCVEGGHVPRYHDEVLFYSGTWLPWDDYLLLETALIRVFLRDDLPLARRLFMAHKMVDVLAAAKLERMRGGRFKELLRILETGLVAEAASEPLPPPARGIAKVLFRQFCFLFQRRQGGSYREMGFRGRLGVRMGNFRRGVRFAMGSGLVDLPAMPAPVDIARIEALRRDPLSAAQEMAISRFLAAKLFGKQHFGRLFFGYSLLQGFNFLLLSAGAVMWYARAHALSRGAERVEDEDVFEAIRYVDFCYGYSSAPALILERLRVRLLGREDMAIRATLMQYA